MSQWAPSMPMNQSRELGATVFGRTMGLVAATVALFGAGAYVARNLTSGLGLLCYLLSFGCLIAMQSMRRASQGTAVGLLFAFGLLMGAATGPTLAYYANAEPGVVSQAGLATALFIGAMGAAGYGARRDLSGIGRICSWALFGLILVGLVTLFVHIPGIGLAYSLLGLVIFAGLTMFDFQRLRRTTDTDSAPYLAVSIFLDALNVFMFFLQIFGNGNRRN